MFLDWGDFHSYFVQLLESHNIQERISHYHSQSFYHEPHTCHASLLPCSLIPSPLLPFVLRPRLTLTQAVVQAALELVILLPQPPEQLGLWACLTRLILNVCEGACSSGLIFSLVVLRGSQKFKRHGFLGGLWVMGHALLGHQNSVSLFFVSQPGDEWFHSPACFYHGVASSFRGLKQVNLPDGRLCPLKLCPNKPFSFSYKLFVTLESSLTYIAYKLMASWQSYSTGLYHGH